MFLVDTNIFLEILLQQEKIKKCQKFLDKNFGNLHISDFSLHSVGIILFKYDRSDIFQKLVEDVLPNTGLLSLPMELYKKLPELNLDFDDAYQYSIAQYYDVKLVTMDKDFARIKDKRILFL